MKTKFILLLGVLLLLSGCDRRLKKEVHHIKSTMATKKEILNLQKQIKIINKEIANIKAEEKIIEKSKQTENLQPKEVNNSLILKINNLQKEINEINATLKKMPKVIKIIKKPTFACKGRFKPTAFITIKKAKIYNSKGKVVKVWPKCITFTSYMEKNHKLRITGIFVHGKWKDVFKRNWWIKIKDVTKKFHGKIKKCKVKYEGKNMRAH